MAEFFNSICLTSVAPTVAEIMGMEASESMAEKNSILLKLAEKKLGGKKADRAVLYNPDAVAMWLYQKYTDLYADALFASDIALPILSVMPSVTPVCFGSMYTGAMPDYHGIKRYEKPVIKVDTLFDVCIRSGKKPVIVSTEKASISMIFLEREMDYFIYDTYDEVYEKALELIEEDIYDLIVIYNGEYDDKMHGRGPEAEASMNALKSNLAFYTKLVDKIKTEWKSHDVLYGFMPDHGCHEIDGGYGSHGIEMGDDMNIMHFYGIKPEEK